MTVSCCASTGSINLASKQAVHIPPAPSFLAPVAVPPIKVGDDARLDLAKTTAALEAANARLKLSRQTYDTMRKRYGGGK